MNRFFRIAFLCITSVIGLLTLSVSSTSAQVFQPEQDVCCSCTSPFDPNGGRLCMVFSKEKMENPTDCSTLPTAAQLEDGWKCEATPLTENRCRPISDVTQSTDVGGVCAAIPVRAGGRTGETIVSEPVADAAEVEQPSIFSSLNINIPGFEIPENGGLLFASYINAIYRYLISIVGIVATIMFIWGAFLYIVGSSTGNISRGKSIMTDAIIGLMLVFSSNLILRTLNPDLTIFKSLDIVPVDSVLWKSIERTSNTSRRQVGLLTSNAIAEAIKTGVPELPCMVKVALQFESGGNLSAIGHDENFTGTAYPVGSRKAFLRGGVTYQGKTFAPITCSQGSNACQANKQKNDDTSTFDANAPPNYGLDLQYTHGFGASQGTVSLKNPPCPGKENMGPGYRVGSRCLTIPELLSPQGATTVLVELNLLNLRTHKGDVLAAMGAYVGIKRNNPHAQTRYAAYQKCMAQGINTLAAASTDSSAAIGSGTSVLLIGDSLAVGLTSPLGKLVKATGATFNSVTRVGMTMNDFDKGPESSRLNQALAQSPDYVLVSLGTNDEYAGASYKAIAEKAYNSLLVKFEKAGSQVYWIGPPTLPAPYVQSRRSPSGEIIPIVRKTKNYFESTLLELPRGDGLHPTPAGYQTWANEIWAWLK